MGVRRKGNPRYHLDVDSLGRRSWKVHPSTVAANAAALRAGLEPDLEPGELESKLNPQLGPDGIIKLRREAERTARAAVDDKAERGTGSDLAKTIVAGGVGSALSTAAFIVAPLAAIPVMLASIATVVGPDARRAWRRRKLRREYETGGVSELGEHRREARELAGLMPHRDGRVEPTSWRIKKGDYMFGVACSVDADGVAEIEWDRSKTHANERLSGTLVLHPGANLRGVGLPFPVRVPGVNLRNANLRDWRVARGSNMDGGDFRGVKASNSEWDGVSLRGATFAGAWLRYADFGGCDMDGVDLTGADVTGAQLPDDLTNVSISREQFDSLRYMGPDDLGAPYTVREVSFDDVLSAAGGDREALTVAMWAGDVEVRDRRTNKVVTGGFDAKKHYIPYWSLDVAKQYTP